MDKKFKQAYQTFLDTWGEEMQVSMAIEEMSELTKALCKMKRVKELGGNYENALENLKEEIADVKNMAEELELVYGEKEIEEIRKQKIERTLNKIKEEKCKKE